MPQIRGIHKIVHDKYFIKLNAAKSSKKFDCNKNLKKDCKKK